MTSEAAVSNAAAQFTTRVASPDLPVAENAPASKVRDAMVFLSLLSGNHHFSFFFFLKYDTWADIS